MHSAVRARHQSKVLLHHHEYAISFSASLYQRTSFAFCHVIYTMMYRSDIDSFLPSFSSFNHGERFKNREPRKVCSSHHVDVSDDLKQEKGGAKWTFLLSEYKAKSLSISVRNVKNKVRRNMTVLHLGKVYLY